MAKRAVDLQSQSINPRENVHKKSCNSWNTVEEGGSLNNQVTAIVQVLLHVSVWRVCGVFIFFSFKHHCRPIVPSNPLTVRRLPLGSGLGSYFGSKFSTRSGILFSNAMSAFFDPALSSEGTVNIPAGGRRPLATFSPAIIMAPKVRGR